MSSEKQFEEDEDFIEFSDEDEDINDDDDEDKLLEKNEDIDEEDIDDDDDDDVVVNDDDDDDDDNIQEEEEEEEDDEEEEDEDFIMNDKNTTNKGSKKKSDLLEVVSQGTSESPFPTASKIDDYFNDDKINEPSSSSSSSSSDSVKPPAKKSRKNNNEKKSIVSHSSSSSSSSTNSKIPKKNPIPERKKRKIKNEKTDDHISAKPSSSSNVNPNPKSGTKTMTKTNTRTRTRTRTRTKNAAQKKIISSAERTRFTKYVKDLTLKKSKQIEKGARVTKSTFMEIPSDKQKSIQKDLLKALAMIIHYADMDELRKNIDSPFENIPANFKWDDPKNIKEHVPEFVNIFRTNYDVFKEAFGFVANDEEIEDDLDNM